MAKELDKSADKEDMKTQQKTMRSKLLEQRSSISHWTSVLDQKKGVIDALTAQKRSLENKVRYEFDV